MIKISIPDSLRDEINAAISTLTGKPGDLREAALVATRVIKFYSEEIPNLFAAHNAAFFRDTVHAQQIGKETDAWTCLTSLQTRAHALQTAPATAENAAWLQNIFDCALRGQLHLRK